MEKLKTINLKHNIVKNKHISMLKGLLKSMLKMLKHFTKLKSIAYNDVEKYVENVEKHEFSTKC